MDEAELIAAARLGNEEAFTQLYQQHSSYVKAIGRAILHNSDVDDMCQDTFLLAFTRLHSFEGSCAFRTWITRIAVNQCLVTLRKGRQPSSCEPHLVRLNSEMVTEEVRDLSTFSSTDAHLEGVPARLDLNRVLRVLKPVQRRVLEMAYLEDMPDQEIAEMLGTSLSSVKSKIYHAKRRVRTIHKKIGELSRTNSNLN